MTSEKIRILNDRFRKTFIGGVVVKTQGISNLPEETQKKLFRLVKNYADFKESNDPYGEHDFGVIHLEGNDFIWKIDYYDLDMEYLSPDPSAPNVTRRVLSILCAGEW